MSLQLIQKLRSHADKRPGDCAIRHIVPASAHTVNWRELRDHVERLTETFRRSLPPGSVVMLCSTNRAEFTAAFLAVLAADMQVFPIAPDIAGPELISAAERSGAAVLLAIGQPDVPVGDAFSGARALPECAADAVLHDAPSWTAHATGGAALLLLSSGTTGRPKIVRRDRASLDAVSANMVEAIGFTADDRVLAAVPLCHSYGMEHGLLCPIWAGSCTHLYDRFDLPAALSELNGAQVSIFPGVPFMFEMLTGGAAEAPTGPIALRRAYCAGGPLPRMLFDAFLAKFGIPVAQLYGATEIGSVTFNDPAIAPFDPTSVGRAMRGVSIRILDLANPSDVQPFPIDTEGHVAIRATSMLSRYIDGEPPTLCDGHFLIGDLGMLNAGGALVITGRIKLLIDVGGRKVNPLEVEQVLASHSLVGDCVVVPVRVSATLCRLRAVVTPARSGQPPSVVELRQFARERLSAYKVPRIFEIRDTLPRSAAGKVLRQVVESEEEQER